jgi:hypothetical protein
VTNGRPSKRRHRNCTNCGLRCDSNSGLCRTCRNPNPKRRWRRCLFCTAVTTAKDGICRTCQDTGPTDGYPEDHPAIALTGGHWQRRGLIQVWITDDHAIDTNTQQEESTAA